MARIPINVPLEKVAALLLEFASTVAVCDAPEDWDK
jgi:hypothetical protein